MELFRDLHAFRSTSQVQVVQIKIARNDVQLRLKIVRCTARGSVARAYLLLLRPAQVSVRPERRKPKLEITEASCVLDRANASNNSSLISHAQPQQRHMHWSEASTSRLGRISGLRRFASF